jgi:hypothetical protein
MIAPAHADELLAFFKALADANRLKIIGVLAQRESTVEQLAAMLDLRPSTVSHHLSKLGEVGLVSARSESYYNVYRLETGTLEDASRRLLAVERIAEAAADVDADAYDREVLANYLLPDGRLKQIPTQRKKLEVILHYLLREFDPQAEYTEKQVNEIIGRYHEDIAGLRRDLVDSKLLARDKRGLAYRRTSS